MFFSDALVVLLLFVDAFSFDAIQLFVVDADSASLILLNVDVAIHVVSLLPLDSSC